ncbi:MAG TPA: Ig-like domain-containing protein [Fibrobacteraceae bacterium]|nr:Ig-like domain-containing protein [Fibrobacteraceae bacterium]
MKTFHSGKLFRLAALGPLLAVSWASASAIYVSADGSSSAVGTLADPMDIATAITSIAAGDTIWVRGGTYSLSEQLTIAYDNCGTADAMKYLLAYDNETPVLDFSGETVSTETSDNDRGIQLEGNYWYLRGLEVANAADNGMLLAGSHNVVELCVFHGNHDTGLQIARRASSLTSIDEWPSYNLVLNCESYDNYDAPPLGGENADGFAAKLTCGYGNVFRGCVSHHNIDDGWDLYTKTATGSIGPVTIDQCISHHNGTLTDGTENADGDKNGFKLGGSDLSNRHIVTRSVAYKNGKNGFTWNSNPGQLEITNNLAWDNVEGNYKFGDNSTNTDAVFTNNISFWIDSSNSEADKTIGTDVSNSNVWWDDEEDEMSVNGNGLMADLSDFKNDLSDPVINRFSNGDLDMSVFELASSSDLLDAGVMPTVDLPYDTSYYTDGKPDLGPYETGGTTASSSSTANSSMQVSSSSATSSSIQNSSSSATSSSNQAPVVTFVTPLNGASFLAPETLEVEVTATDADGEVANVQLYLDGKLVRQENGSPYQWNDQDQDSVLQGLTVGAYTLRALATDDDGITGESSISIEVLSSTEVISIFHPKGNFSFQILDLRGRFLGADHAMQPVILHGTSKN